MLLQAKVVMGKCRGRNQLNNSKIKQFANSYKLGDAQTNRYFGVELPQITAIQPTDRVGMCSDLLLLANINGKQQVSLISLKLWCPAMLTYNHVESIGVNPDDVRSPSISVEFRPDNRLVFFGDVSNKFFVSVFDTTRKKCELSFCAIGIKEAACIDCEGCAETNWWIRSTSLMTPDKDSCAEAIVKWV